MNPARWNRCKQGLHTHTHTHTHTQHVHTCTQLDSTKKEPRRHSWIHGELCFSFGQQFMIILQKNLMIYFPFIHKIIAKKKRENTRCICQKPEETFPYFSFSFFLFSSDQRSKPLILESEAKNLIFAGREHSNDFIWAFVFEQLVAFQWGRQETDDNTQKRITFLFITSQFMFCTWYFSCSTLRYLRQTRSLLNLIEFWWDITFSGFHCVGQWRLVLYFIRCTAAHVQRAK